MDEWPQIFVFWLPFYDRTCQKMTNWSLDSLKWSEICPDGTSQCDGQNIRYFKFWMNFRGIGMKLSVCLGEIQWFWHLNFPNVRYFFGSLLLIFYEYGLQWRDWVGQEPKSNSGPTRIRLKTLYNRLWGFVDDSSPPKWKRTSMDVPVWKHLSNHLHVNM